MPPFLLGLSVVGFLLISVLMVLIVLVQRPQGGGLSGAFGASAGGSGQTAFGAKTGDALTIATITIFVLFILTSIAINFAVRPSGTAPAEPAAQSTETGTTGGVIDQAATAPPTTTTPTTTPSEPAPVQPAPADSTPPAPTAAPSTEPAQGAPEN